MKTSERFDRAISALVKGYFNGTLAKGSCEACAIGNMISHSMQVKIETIDFGDYLRFRWNGIAPDWDRVFVTGSDGEQRLDPEYYEDEAKSQIDATGYTYLELARIEKAFECNTAISHIDYRKYKPAEIEADQYSGLCAVVAVLCEIEGITDAEPFKAMFAKA